MGVRQDGGGGRMTRIEMTNEEAINYFKRSYASGDTDDERQHNEALDMAIKSLGKQLCEDCISREAVINTIFYKADNNSDVVLSTDLMDRIKHLPSVTPTARWISCSERLPDYGQEVLLFDKNFGYVVGTYEMVNYFGVTEPSFLIHKSIDSLEKASIDPIAWMPLPEPYTESEDKECQQKNCHE